MKTYKCIFCNSDCIYNSKLYAPYCRSVTHTYDVYPARYDQSQISEEVLKFDEYFINYQFIHPRIEKAEMRRIFISDAKKCITVPVPGLTYENKPLLVTSEDIENFLLLA